jgi:hypothetical protein
VKTPMSSFAKRKLEALKADKSNAAVWASLFTRADAVASATAERLGVSKADLFAGSAGESAVRLGARRDADAGRDDQLLSRARRQPDAARRRLCAQSHGAMVVKNLPFGCERRRAAARVRATLARWCSSSRRRRTPWRCSSLAR